METINLKQIQRKRYRLQKILIILLILSGLSLILKNIKIKYRYTIIDNQGNQIILGISKNNNLIDETLYETINQLKEQQYEISDYNLSTYIQVQKIYTFDKDSDLKELKNKIKNCFLIKVYAVKFTYNNNDYYFHNKYNHYIYDNLKLKIPDLKINFLEGTFININQVMSIEEMENFIDNL